MTIGRVGDKPHRLDPGRPRLPVAVVIPAYNAERFIGEAIASVRSQTARPADVIVVDDGTALDRLPGRGRSRGAPLAVSTMAAVGEALPASRGGSS